jgi:hypothetical protein
MKSETAVLGTLALAGVGYLIWRSKAEPPPHPQGVSAKIGAVSLNTQTYHRGDQVTITANVKNTGTAAYTFYLGCSIIAPNNWVTDSKDFNPPQVYKEITLLPNQSGSVVFTEILGQNTGSGIHEVVVAVWDSYPFVEPRLDDAFADMEVLADDVISADITNINFS